MNAIQLESQVTFLAAADGDSAASPKRFRIVAYTGSPIRQGWSREPVVIDMAGMKLPASVPVVIGHDYSLGSILGQGVPSVVDGQLILEGEILADTDAARQVATLAERGYAWQASVGADVRRHQKIDADVAATVNGQAVAGPVRIVRASALREVSFVTLGADAETSVAIAAEEVVEEITMADHANDTPEVEAVTAAASEAPADVAVETKADNTSELLTQLHDVTERLRKMEELDAIRTSRHTGIHVVDNSPPRAEVIEAAFALQGNLPGVERKYSDRVLEAAHQHRRNISLGEVMVQAAVAGGYDGPRRLTSQTLRPILQAAFLQAAWSDHAISGILSSTVNKFLLAGFDSVENSWRMISSVRSVNDFKTITQYRLNGGFVFEPVANGGELKHATASDESRTISDSTYGIMTSVTRTDLINDDLGALTAVPQRIGRGGALKLNSVFWSSFVDDASFFTTAKGNKKASATALSLAGLKEALALYRKLTDADGNPIAVTPRMLVVPVDLEITAAELMNSVQVSSGNTSGQPATNVFAGRYEVVSSTYLTNTADYYLLASPADLPVMEVAFLNGVQSPIVETAEADFNTLGVQMRGYFDFGVAKAEDKAGVKMDV